MEIINQQQDENGPALWHFKFGGLASDGKYRLADLSQETTDPATWLTENTAEAQALIDAGEYNQAYDLIRLANAAGRDFASLPNWATWTGQQAADFVHGDVLGGMDRAALEAWVDTNVTTLATAKTALKLLGDELIDLREIVENVARAVMFLRDITAR